ncbi:hypothetical protein BC830DRAFT_1170717 [Chytriomyces sp. MP71]|nr:hypothetical protein BC830DRAFT_1170717 [Chytriomyces sp. MP71]
MSFLINGALELSDIIIYRGFPGIGLGDLKKRSKPFKAKDVINTFKFAALPFCVGLMAYHRNYSWTASIFTAMHGTYGILWIVKDRLFPDPQWEANVPIESTILTATIMTTYLAADYLCISRFVEVTPFFAASCIAMHSIGMVLMMGTDTQRHFQLKYKKGLISDGWMSKSRNTNYLGETMIYGSYFLMSQHWFPWVLPGMVMTLMFMGNMTRKEKSLRKKDGAEEYFKKSWAFFPKFW